MDDSLAALERAYQADRSNLTTLQQLVKARERSGHQIEDRSISEWLEGLSAEDWRARGKAVWRLKKLEEKAEFAVPALIQAFQTERSTTVRGMILHALGSTGCEAVVPMLVEASKEAPMDVRWMAFRALEALGAKAKAAVPRLREFFAEPQPGSTFEAALKAFATIDPDQAIPVFCELLNSDSLSFQVRAAVSLGNLGSAAKDALPRLKELSEGDLGWASSFIQRSITAIESGAKA